MEMAKKNAFLGIGTVLTALGASLCCILPVAVAFLGVGSAALGAKFEPFRPYFLVLTVGFLGFAFFREYRPRKAEDCAPGEICAVPEKRRRQRILLWLVAAIVLVLVTFPYYANWLF